MKDLPNIPQAVPEAKLTDADYEALCHAWLILGRLGGNTADNPFRDAWLALRDVVQ